MKNKKILFGIIALVVIVLIILIITLIARNNFLDEDKYMYDDDGNLITEDEPLGDLEEAAINNRERLTNTTYFFSIEQYINNYLDAIQLKNPTVLISILDQNYLQENNLTDHNIISNVETSYDFIATEIYETRDKTLYSYIVKGVKDDGIYNEEHYYIFDLDLSNYTYKITPLYNNNYTNINQIKAKTNLEEIAENENNSFDFLRLSTEEIYSKYIKYFINILVNNPSKAYTMIDEEYNQIRFSNNYNNFINYITIMNNNNKIDSEIKEISQYSNEEYIVKTKNDNRYIIKVNFPMDFKVKLDEYTIITDNFKQAYSNATDTQKISTNVDKIMKMINNYDYQNLYNLLDGTYKTNNFGNINSFINYISTNFFNSNYYEIKSIQTEESTSTIEIKVYKDGSANAEYNFNKIIIKLAEDTNFTFYFI